MTETTYFGLKKPDDTDSTDQRPFNENADIIDEALHDRYTKEESREQHQTLAAAITKNRNALVAIVDGGAKNVIQFDAIGNSTISGSTFTSAGVQFTLNADYSITAERVESDSGNAICNLRLNGASFYIDDYCDGDYVITGCPADGSLTSYNIAVVQSGGGYEVRDLGEGADLIDRQTATNIYVSLRVQSSFSGTITFKPMICSAAALAISSAYQPFRPSYQELYERVLALEGGV